MYYRDFFYYLLTHLGNIYIADSYNHRIRKVTLSTGIIATIAGSGTSGYSGDNGAATSAAIYYPVGITLDSSGTCIHCVCCQIIDLLTM